MSVSIHQGYGTRNLNSQVSSSNTQNAVHQKRHHHNEEVNVSQGAEALAQSSTTAKSPLSSLVSDGTITSDQEKAIKESLEASRMAYQTQAGAASAQQDPLANLVSSGKLTADQASAVKNVMEAGRHNRSQGMQMQPPPPPPQGVGGKEGMSSTLSSLVGSGTISTEQKSSIIEALEAAFKSAEDSDSDDDSSTTTKTDPLDSLVKTGTITKEQQSAIKSTFEAALKAYQNQSYDFNDSLWNNSFDVDM